MAIRITTIAERDSTIIKVDGRVQNADVDELMRTCSELQGPFALDLADVASVDREAVAVLRQLVRLSAELRAVSPYIKLLLESIDRSVRRPDGDEV
jgi:ABC-type transporter Mla MlaB component